MIFIISFCLMIFITSAHFITGISIIINTVIDNSCPYIISYLTISLLYSALILIISILSQVLYYKDKISPKILTISFFIRFLITLLIMITEYVLGNIIKENCRVIDYFIEFEMINIIEIILNLIIFMALTLMSVAFSRYRSSIIFNL